MKHRSYLGCGIAAIALVCWLPFRTKSASGPTTPTEEGRMAASSTGSRHQPPNRSDPTASAGPKPPRKTSLKFLLMRAEAIITDREREASPRRAELAALCGELSPEEFPAMGETVRKAHGYELFFEVVFVNEWARFDPNAALEFALPGGTTGEALVEWSNRDLEAALAWMSQHREAASWQVFDKLARIDRERVSDLINAYPESEWQYQVREGMLRVILEQDGAAALRDWISEVEKPGMRHALMETAGCWSPMYGDPAATMAWLEAEPADTANGWRGTFLKKAGEKHPEWVKAYFDGLPPEKHTPEVLKSVVEALGEIDLQAAVDLIGRHPECAGKEAAQGLIRAAMLENPEMILTWIGSQEDAGLRQSMRKEALGYWLANRVEIAKDWIENHGTEEDRELARRR